MNAKARARVELSEIRARLVAFLSEGIPTLTASAAQAVLEHAKAWSPQRARELDDHIALHPRALTEPDPSCPRSLVRVLDRLAATGHGEAITLLPCATCGRSGLKLVQRTPNGHHCYTCSRTANPRPCARCGRVAPMKARREEGSICNPCYLADPLVQAECADCGRRRPASTRREDGTALCAACAPKPLQVCTGCGETRQAAKIGADGPLCHSCYRSPARPCGVCGRVRQITVRAAGGRPDICGGCYRGRVGECAVCGRIREGHVHHESGIFRCNSCRLTERPVKPCADCGNVKPVAALWPLGPICDACYPRRRRSPGPCSACGTTRVLVGASPQGDGLCGPCCGTDIDFACRRCGSPGDIYADGHCCRCVASERAHALLSDEDGRLSPQLKLLAEGLAAAPRPNSALQWMSTSPAANLLAGLASRQAEITHELLDGLDQDYGTRHLRELMVSFGLLPARQEDLVLLELWLPTYLARLPGHHIPLVRPFAEWHVLRDARRRAARGRYTPGAAGVDRSDIRAAHELLTWLDGRGLKLADLDQETLDLWLTGHPTRLRATASFVRWSVARRLTRKLDLPTRPKGLPSRFVTEDEFADQVRRCLNDDTLPLEVRIAGALVRLYALPVTRIVELTADRFHRDGENAYLTISRNPVLLPPKLARLVEEQTTNPRRLSTFVRPDHEGPGFLFPGRSPSRHRRPTALHATMRQHGLPVIGARNTAMLEAVSDLPPIVISDLFGINASVAYSWARLAQDSWSDYLAAVQNTQ